MNQPDVVSASGDANVVFDLDAPKESFEARVSHTGFGTLRIHVPKGQEIYSAGIDLVDVNRMGRLMRQYGSMFERRVATAAEARRLPRDPAPRVRGLAGLFAVKESVLKVLGGMPKDGRFTDISADELNAGSPGTVALHGALAGHAGLTGVRSVFGGIVDGTHFGLGWQLAWAAGLRGEPVSTERNYAGVAALAVRDGMGTSA